MNPESESQPENKNLKHSRCGIASFVILMVNGLLICCLFIYAMITQAMKFGHGPPPSPTESLIMGTLGVAIIVLSLVGFILRWVGARQQNRRKLFGVLGIVFNSLPLFVIVLFLSGLRPHAMSALTS